MKPSLLERCGLAGLWNFGAIQFYSWALREINPMHPDVPYIVRRLNELQRSA
jgi:hypothetical protein